MFEVSKWLDELVEENNPHKKKDTNNTANLATDNVSANMHNKRDTRKKSRSPYTHSTGGDEDNTSERSNVYFDRDIRSNRDGNAGRNNGASRDRTRSNYHRTPQGDMTITRKEYSHYKPQHDTAIQNNNVHLKTPNATNSYLTYKVAPDGQMGWY